MNTTQTKVRGTLAPLLSIAVIMALFSFAQTFAASSDDFNDNIKNSSKWGTDQQRVRGPGGSSVLTETNQRLEYTSRLLFFGSYAARPWILTQFPSNADWEIQIDIFNVTRVAGDAAFGIELHGPHNSSDRVFAALYSSWGLGGFSSVVTSAAGTGGSAYSGEFAATNGAVRIAFDGSTKVITVLYDYDVTDGYQWVENGSFGIAGAGGANGNTNWGLAEGDQFSAFVYGGARSEHVRDGIGSGSMFGDNFMETGGVPPKAASVGNISTRGRVEIGENVMIGGFIVTGTASKQVVVRGLGPTLAQFGVTGVLADPTLQLFDGSGDPMWFNDNWKDTQQAGIQATGLAPPNDAESAIRIALQPGNYTAVLAGKNGTSGVGLVEVYDIETGVLAHLTNVSTRGFVGSGQNVVICGLIIQENSPAKVIVRAIGPSLTQAGIVNPLQDPTLELHDGNGALIISNDNWKESQQAEIQATGLVPSNNAESAIVATLSPGTYTAIVRGKNETSGVALVETYQLGN